MSIKNAIKAKHGYSLAGDNQMKTAKSKDNRSSIIYLVMFYILKVFHFFKIQIERSWLG